MSAGWWYLNPLETFPEIESKSLFISLLGIELLPPHVALIHLNHLYSFSIRGVEIHPDAMRVLKKIWLTRQCAIIECTALQNEDLPEKVYNLFDTLQPGSSCIDPILALLKHEWNIVPEKPFLHGLLHALQENKKLLDCFVSFPCAKAFELKAYNRHDIDNRIAELQVPGRA